MGILWLFNDPNWFFMTAPKKRFIAGAVCPKCSAMDRIVMFKLNGKDYRECVACNFSDVLHVQTPARELETRVNITPEEKIAQTQTIKIIDPS